MCIYVGKYAYIHKKIWSGFLLQGITGNILRDELWKAAMSCTTFEYYECMNAIRSESEEAFKWLDAIGKEKWSRAWFSTRSKCDLMVNNITESFNQYIKSAGEKPVITMLEN